jgi:dihydroorotase
MTEKTLLKNIAVVNEGQITVTDVLIENGLIRKIGQIDDVDANIMDGTGKYLFPGIIDGQVHFREPGLTHKADLYTEQGSRRRWHYLVH